MKQRKLTLDETWKYCLAMWKWIAKQGRAGCDDIYALKYDWVKAHGFGDWVLCANCFFCEYAEKIAIESDIPFCSNCPGQKVDCHFRCRGTDYEYAKHPIEFYNKLVSLNRKRLAKRKT